MKPIKSVRNEGKCDSCLAKEMRVIRAGNYCDHCRKNATQSLIYINRKTKKRYCVDCRSVFHRTLITKGFSSEDANKILVEDFILVNDPTKKTKIHRS
jgi:hypothetical protein